MLELKGTFPEDAVALGIEPHVVELQDGLSATVEEAMPRLLGEILAQLRTWGHEVPHPAGSACA